MRAQVSCGEAEQIEAAVLAQEQQLEIRFAELDVDDRKDARFMARETTLTPQMVLTALFIVGYFVILGLFFSSTLKVPMDDSFKIMLGVLTAGVTQILAFWFGSSKGSKDGIAFAGWAVNLLSEWWEALVGSAGAATLLGWIGVRQVKRIDALERDKATRSELVAVMKKIDQYYRRAAPRAGSCTRSSIRFLSRRPSLISSSPLTWGRRRGSGSR